MDDEVDVQIGGQTYRGWFSVEKKLITVFWEHEQRTTQVGGTPPHLLAKHMVRELVLEQQQRGRRE